MILNSPFHKTGFIIDRSLHFPIERRIAIFERYAQLKNETYFNKFATSIKL